MRIGLCGGEWWKTACEVCGFEAVNLPLGQCPGGPYAAGFDQRCSAGSAMADVIAGSDLSFLLDNGGMSLSFVEQEAPESLHLLHEALGLPLVTQFIDPIHVCLQGLRWPAVWHALQSRTWIKAVWDFAHASELQQLGVPGVTHLPMAAPDRAYNTQPLDARRCRPVVSFVGGQSTRYFVAGVSPDAAELFAGTLVQAVRSDLRGSNFYDVYHDLYGLAAANGSTQDESALAERYLAAKLYYHAALAIANRDRFVIFLSRKLGEIFELIGRRWKEAYGLNARPPLPTTDSYFDHFREVAINLNLVNGNAETGLNMRHFEISAAGGFMLCRRQPELGQWFCPGRECAVFEDEADLLDKIAYYLAHPDERAEIAYAGQLRTLSEHLYSHRLMQVISALKPARKPAAVACQA